jgi:hypothetical protein
MGNRIGIHICAPGGDESSLDWNACGDRHRLWQNGLAAFVLLPFALAAPGEIGAFGAREIMLLIVLGLGCTALAHTLFIGDWPP